MVSCILLTALVTAMALGFKSDKDDDDNENLEEFE